MELSFSELHIELHFLFLLHILEFHTPTFLSYHDYLFMVLFPFCTLLYHVHILIFKGGWCYYNLIILLMMQTDFVVIMCMIIPGIYLILYIVHVSCVAYWVIGHILRVDILVILRVDILVICYTTFLLSYPYLYMFHVTFMRLKVMWKLHIPLYILYHV